MSSFSKIVKKVKDINPSFSVKEDRNCILLEGETDKYEEIISAGKASVSNKYLGVVNNIHLKGFKDDISTPVVEDYSLDNLKIDCLVIGGGVVGSAILRELSKYRLHSILIEKESDLCMHQSGKNGGVIHVGIDMKKHPIKASYCIRGNKMFDKLSQDLEVPFERTGQVVIIKNPFEKILCPIMKGWARELKIPGVKYLKRDELLKVEPEVPSWARGGVYMPTGGIINPFLFTVALAENAVSNGAIVSLNTIALSMEIENGIIKSVLTNKGRIYPKVVINAAGIHADEIADMANDRTFTIHPRKGTDIILDKKVGYIVKGSFSKSPLTIVKEESLNKKKKPFEGIREFITYKEKHVSKGLGTIHSIDGNALIGPTAIETPYKEDYSTDSESFNSIIVQQKLVSNKVQKGDIIAYFSGTRASNYEEDFVVRKGIFTKNIMEAACIQSPGLTAAPAIAEDIVSWTVSYLQETQVVMENKFFNPHHKTVKPLKDLPISLRDKLIKSNPDYGEIVCRCEEISKGEILDLFNSPIPVYTLDAIKRRIRPGMGRCQGSFCSPVILKMLAAKRHVDIEKITKSNEGSEILLGSLKGDQDD